MIPLVAGEVAASVALDARFAFRADGIAVAAIKACEDTIVMRLLCLTAVLCLSLLLWLSNILWVLHAGIVTQYMYILCVRVCVFERE